MRKKKKDKQRTNHAQKRKDKQKFLHIYIA